MKRTHIKLKHTHTHAHTHLGGHCKNMYGHGYYYWGRDVFLSNLAYGEKRKVDLVSSTTLCWNVANEDQLSTKPS
jgi:hypothetical protein